MGEGLQNWAFLRTQTGCPWVIPETSLPSKASNGHDMMQGMDGRSVVLFTIPASAATTAASGQQAAGTASAERRGWQRRRSHKSQASITGVPTTLIALAFLTLVALPGAWGQVNIASVAVSCGLRGWACGVWWTCARKANILPQPGEGSCKGRVAGGGGGGMCPHS